jgi:glycosyltransferase involved in cell wall biosynthesis
VDEQAIFDTVDSITRQKTENTTNSKTELIFVGRLVSIKNLIELPEIVSKLPPKYKLIIVGDGPRMRDIEGAIENYNIKNRVELKGQ